MKVVTVIPARGGSKGIPRKNLVKVGSIPLAVRSINASLASGAAETWVSTEDPEIRAVAVLEQADKFDRASQRDSAGAGEPCAEIIESQNVCKYCVHFDNCDAPCDNEHSGFEGRKLQPVATSK